MTVAPITTPMAPWASRYDQEGMRSSVGEVSACAIPPTSAANSTADGSRSSESPTLSTRVTATTRASAARGVRSAAVTVSLVSLTGHQVGRSWCRVPTVRE